MSEKEYWATCQNPRCGNFVYHLQSQCEKCGWELFWEKEADCRNCGWAFDHSTRSQCPNCWTHATVWTSIITETRQTLPPRQDMVIAKRAVVHPEELDLEQSVAAPKGQSADYRISLEDSTSIHIKEYEDHFKVHWDEKDPVEDPIGHLATDAPGWGIVLGAGVAYAASQFLN